MIRHKKDKEKFLESGIINEAAMFAFLNNQLSEEEKQKFNELLKEDPFAQDALEGLQRTQNQAAVLATVEGLNKKVRERSGLKEKGTIQLHWSNYAYAAVLVGLLLGIGFVMVNYLGNNNGQVAMNKETKTEQTPFEQKPEQTNLVPAEGSVINDSVPAQPPTIIENTLTAPTGKKSPDVPSPTINTSDAIAGKANHEPVQLNITEPGTITAAGSSTAQTISNSALPAAPASGVAAEKKAAPAKERSEEKEINQLQLRAKEKPASQNDGKAKQANDQETAPAFIRVERGAIVEREEGDKANSVITIDDATRSFNTGDYKKSAQQFEEILREQPKNPDALYFGGISNYINGDIKKSEKNFDKLLKDGSKFVDGSKWYKANILLQKGKKDEAKKLLDELSESGGSYKERALRKKADAGL